MIDRQKIDCNCNDCIFMVRDMDKFKQSQADHNRWQLDYFNTIRNKLIDKAIFYKKIKNDLERWDALLTEAENMKFMFNKSTAMINYGYCNKLNKSVTFIPNQCQLETQECFKHRKDI